MTSEDRCGLEGDPEVRRARRLQLGIFSAPAWIGPAVSWVLGTVGASLLFTAHHWPGWLGGALGIVAALLSFLAWRKALNALDGPPRLFGLTYGGWLLISFIVFGQAYDLETRLNAGPLRPGDLIFSVVWLLLACAYAWQTAQRNRRV